MVRMKRSLEEVEGRTLEQKESVGKAIPKGKKLPPIRESPNQEGVFFLHALHVFLDFLEYYSNGNSSYKDFYIYWSNEFKRKKN